MINRCPHSGGRGKYLRLWGQSGENSEILKEKSKVQVTFPTFKRALGVVASGYKFQYLGAVETKGSRVKTRAWASVKPCLKHLPHTLLNWYMHASSNLFMDLSGFFILFWGQDLTAHPGWLGIERSDCLWLPTAGNQWCVTPHPALDPDCVFL